MNVFRGIACPTPQRSEAPDRSGAFFDLDVRQSHTDLQVETPEAFPR
jgi:hypothetical protein